MNTPPYQGLIENLQNDDIEAAISLWTSYCTVDGKCTRQYHNQMPLHLYCANMLHANLLGKSMGGENAESELYYAQAKKLQHWISEREQKNDQPGSSSDPTD